MSFNRDERLHTAIISTLETAAHQISSTEVKPAASFISLSLSYLTVSVIAHTMAPEEIERVVKKELEGLSRFLEQTANLLREFPDAVVYAFCGSGIIHLVEDFIKRPSKPVEIDERSSVPDLDPIVEEVARLQTGEDEEYEDEGDEGFEDCGEWTDLIDDEECNGDGKYGTLFLKAKL